MKNPFFKSDGSGASFLPQEYVARKNEMRANLICLSLFGVVMFGVIGAFFVTNRQWLQVKEKQKAVTVQYTQEGAKIEQYKRLESQKAEMMDKAEITTALVEKVPRSKLVSELVTRLPRDITLMEVQLVSKRIKEAAGRPGGATSSQPGQIKTLGSRPSGQISAAKSLGAAGNAPPKERVSAPRFEFTVRLVGVARVNTDVADYMRSLEVCPLLGGVELRHIKEQVVDKVELRRFEIEAMIRKDADARGLQTVDLKTATVGGAPGADPKRAADAPAPGGRNMTSVTGGKEN